MNEYEDLCAKLTREPDLDVAELQAYDSADLLLLETARDLHALAAISPGSVAVIGDRHGALTLGVAHTVTQQAGAAGVIRVYQDPLLHERALAQNAVRFGLQDAYAAQALGAELLEGADLVVMQLPRSLAELDEIAYAIARYANPEVTVLAGGRDKHMSRGMNEVFAKYFDSVMPGRGKRKARVLTMTGRRELSSETPAPFPVLHSAPPLGFDLAAYGATFGGASLDRGSKFLLQTLGILTPKQHALHNEPSPETVVDLGCGNGVLAVSAALAWPRALVLATDQSQAAVRATKLTALEAGVADQVRVVRADATEAVDNGWADLILLNPPFHAGSTVHSEVAYRLIRSCAAALAPQGEVWIVHNSHLRYRTIVEAEIGFCEQVARNETFTVLRAVRR